MQVDGTDSGDVYPGAVIADQKQHGESGRRSFTKTAENLQLIMSSAH